MRAMTGWLLGAIGAGVVGGTAWAEETGPRARLSAETEVRAEAAVVTVAGEARVQVGKRWAVEAEAEVVVAEARVEALEAAVTLKRGAWAVGVGLEARPAEGGIAIVPALRWSGAAGPWAVEAWIAAIVPAREEAAGARVGIAVAWE